MGPAAVSCLCAPGYTGDLWEVEIAPPGAAAQSSCVAIEFNESLMSPHRYESGRPEYTSRPVLEPVMRIPSPQHFHTTAYLNNRSTTDFPPCNRRSIPQNTCTLCMQSNHDVSKIPSAPIKSWVKKIKNDCSTCVSLPSMEVINDEPKAKSDIQLVNKQWQKAYFSPDTDKMLNKLSNDLDFLLNRTLEMSEVLDQIAEAPT